MALLGAQFVNAVSPNPVGSLQAFAGASAPTGWLLCDGSAVSRTVYPELFSVLGTTYGAGDGSTTFGLPDLRGRMPIGAGNDGTAANNATRTRGDKGGDTRMPQHNHQLGGILTQTVPSSSPTVYVASYGNGSPETRFTSNNGSGTGENMPPFLVTNYIIKAVPDAPRSGLAYGSTPPIVTALPANPQFGDVVTYIADATNGVAWNLQYDASGTYPWKFIGGAALYSQDTGSISTSSGSFVAVAGDTISISVGLPGDYDVVTTMIAAQTGAFLWMLMRPTGCSYPTGDGDGVRFGSESAGAYKIGTRTRRATLTAGTLTANYKQAAGGTATFTERSITVTPVRVKAP